MVEFIVDRLKASAKHYQETKKTIYDLSSQIIKLEKEKEEAEAEKRMKIFQQDIDEGRILIEEITKDWSRQQTIKVSLNSSHEQIRLEYIER